MFVYLYGLESDLLDVRPSYIKLKRLHKDNGGMVEFLINRLCFLAARVCCIGHMNKPGLFGQHYVVSVTRNADT